MMGCTPPAPGAHHAGKASRRRALRPAERLRRDSFKDVKLVSMKVDMHCPFGCYPKVKETLET